MNIPQYDVFIIFNIVDYYYLIINYLNKLLRTNFNTYILNNSKILAKFAEQILL